MIQIAHASLYNHALPKDHRFPMLKYELIPEQLLYEGIIKPNNLFHPRLLEDDEITLTHSPTYLQDLKKLRISDSEIRRIGFPLSDALILREICIAGGTVDGCYKALENGIGFNIAGGTHHAFSNKGEGFCLLNDQAIAANHLLASGKVRKILIIDLDVHQGNGTAEIFKNEPRVFTFSMHGKNNFPFHKEISDLDIALPDKIVDEDYLELLESTLPDLLENEKPDFLFFLAGVDILQTDKYGKLSISLEGCKKRDEMVIAEAFRRKIPLFICMGGGYSPKISDIINAHCNTFRIGFDYYS